MKRSEVNAAITHAVALLEKNNLRLPPFAYWPMDVWREKLASLDNLRQTMLGWDVTDFGSGDFPHCGSVLFTVRNGIKDDSALGTPYAEKLIFQRHETEQEIPFHYHTDKTEDIINRGGGLLALELYRAAPDGSLDKATPVRVRMDGIDQTFTPGQVVLVEKGASITLTPRLYHRFYAKRGEGDLIIGEVSSINDDKADNAFLVKRPRFSQIEADEPMRYPLCNEYDAVV